MEAKSIADSLIEFINSEILDSSPPYFKLDKEHEWKIRHLIDTTFKEGYQDCLKDVREGLIK